MKKAVVLWTGGKDSAFALHESVGKFSIDRLVTFVPENQPNFFAHSLQLMKAQAKSMGLKHECMMVKEPYDVSYKEAIAQIKRSNIDTLITGDISTIDGYPNWIRECADGIMEVYTPLWEMERKKVLQQIVPNNYKIICSLSYKKDFEETITGKFLDSRLIDELLFMEEKGKIDAAGENGEYHTMVLSAPFFKYDLKLVDSKIVETECFSYLEIGNVVPVENE